MGKKTKSFISENPKLVAEWHPTKNGDTTPDQVASGSSRKKYWWYCFKCGEDWDDVPYHRTRGDGCPFCAGKRIGKSNSLAINYPELVDEWNYEKNSGQTPYDFVFGSSKRVWWICKKGHEWDEVIRVRTKGSINLRVLGCPYCSGHRVSEMNSLENLYPHLIEEWDFKKNGDLKPSEVSFGSSIEVWWKCVKGHGWKAPVHRRTHDGGRGCSKCKNKTSFPEQAVYYYIKKIFPNAKNRYQHRIKNKRTEIDIFIPELKIGIEYDGYYYHKNSLEKDNVKTFSLSNEGITLIRVRHKDLPELTPNDNLRVIIVEDDSLSALESALKIIYLMIGQGDNINKIYLRNDIRKIYSLFKLSETNNSFASKNPELVKMWHPTKNNGLSPSNFSPNSDFRAWWLCERSHEWEATITKINKGNRCPYCSNKKVNNENSLFAVFPEVASEWNYEKNGNLTPHDIVYGSHKKVWWKCKNNHEWQTNVFKRTKQKHGCTECKNYTYDQVSQYFMDQGCKLLETIYINRNTKMKYICSCGNDQAIISFTHFLRGQRCRVCMPQRIKAKRNKNKNT